MGSMNIQMYLEEIGEWALTSGLQILLVIVVMLIASRVIHVAVNRAIGRIGGKEDLELQKRSDTLRSIINSLVSVVIFAVGLMIILGQLGIAIGPILAAAGVLGLAVGFGAQSLVGDVISGFFILLEDQIRVGDVVQIAGKGGLVEKVSLRMVILRDLAGNVHYVRNGTIDVVTNMTKDYSRYVFDIGVAYREDVDEVIEVIRAVDEELRRDPAFAESILEPIEILGLDEFADSAIIIKARTKTKPIKQWEIGREFNRRLKQSFDRHNIEIPFPHLTLYMGQDKQGSSPVLRVQSQDSR
ncbi:MAG: mechanosensitive ion channel family protein [Spirochaetaceae bacterium]|nr:MAG: mechanosensitive ion channel family protein [Spirochaetaceae bacterium]